MNTKEEIIAYLRGLYEGCSRNSVGDCVDDAEMHLLETILRAIGVEGYEEDEEDEK